MSHRSTRQVVEDLRKNDRLIEMTEPLSTHLEIAEVQRRVYARGGPAILFSNPIGSSFPMVSNLFGSLDQARFLFRKTIDRVRRAIELKIDPNQLFMRPWRYASAPWTAWTMLPRSVRSGSVQRNETTIDGLPRLVSWPDDGGPFVTLPQVVSQGATSSLMQCNLGMYRVQLSGNDYQIDREIGLHYQLHRGIGVHHQQALADGRPFRVAISVGGTPAMTVAAVMPLPEGLSELTFAGALAGHRIPMITCQSQSQSHAPLYADADFAIYGTIDPQSMKREGPFGDHLGYYAKEHDFPWMRVDKVYHRDGAIWPFTVVGRPPQEDTTFGQLIHELTGPIIPTVLPGVKAVHAVDAAGVHPLLLAIGSERYSPYRKPDRPQELLTQANAILGQGQMSLAKYLLIINALDNPSLDIHHIDEFLVHLLERIDWSRDLHFQTRTTMDTLDYSGDGFNQGSKVVMAASGQKRCALSTELPQAFSLPNGFSNPRWCLPGVLAIEATSNTSELIHHWDGQTRVMGAALTEDTRWSGTRLVVLADDSEFTSRSLNNFLWVTFTRSNPANDIYGIGAFTDHKHWGCLGPLVIDARRKPHHAPPLIEDEQVSAKIDALAAKGGPIAKYL
jgi:4-hydroxy-3-polyprenylbenzoate decarboxylase